MADQPHDKVEQSQSFRRYWRVVHTNPPSAWDFTSHAAKGIPLRDDDPESMRLHAGISVFDQRRYARRLALRAPILGHLLAEIHLSTDAPIVVERTTKSHGHYTLWGDPEFLLGCVATVTSANEEPDQQKG